MTNSITSLKDVLYCENACSKTAYKKIMNMWAGTDRGKDLESRDTVSALSADELTMLNRIFGSSSNCYSIKDKDLQKSILTLMPHDLYRNFRRATYNRNQAVIVEDWIWMDNDDKFLDELDIELTCLEGLLVGFLLYLLGGFKIPKDDIKRHMDPWIRVDLDAMFNRPREIFLLTDLSPAVLSRYLYWKSTSVLMGLMRHFAPKSTADTAIEVQSNLAAKGII